MEHAGVMRRWGMGGHFSTIGVAEPPLPEVIDSPTLTLMNRHPAAKSAALKVNPVAP